MMSPSFRSTCIAIALVLPCACGDASSSAASSPSGGREGGGSTHGDDGGAPGAEADAGGGPASDDAAAAADGQAASRCTATAAQVTCTYQQETVQIPGGSRTVYWQVPLGKPPAGGWPVVLVYQGSFFEASTFFVGTPSDPFGQYYGALMVKNLLDAGYGIIAPDAAVNGSTYWETNVPPYSTDWSSAPDNALVDALLAQIASGSLGPLDGARLYATGPSSGGYMTSRMAVSYQGKFRALAIESASYATCGGPACTIPTPLPSDHPPTLFLHGGQDPLVPVSTMEAYNSDLVAEGRQTKVVIDPNAGHQWIAAAPTEVPAWFEAHP
jgi:poly(3-hydroxybutyrate) depolymerase